MDQHAFPGMAPGLAPNLAIVDDEPDMRAMVADYLTREGYRVSACASGAELDRLIESGAPDLVLLDVALPGEDGLSIARRLRAGGPVSIIMLSAMADLVDRIVGLEIGADDYVTKPFDLRELRARVRAVLRRASSDQPCATAATRGETPRSLVSFGRATLDLESFMLLDESGGQVRLTAGEFNLLAAFARNPHRVMTRDMLLDTAPARDDDPFDRAIDIRIARIRKKIEIEPSKPQVIRTVRGVGYMFVPPANAA
jgi:DNA-binding response OmpR family regulator